MYAQREAEMLIEQVEAEDLKVRAEQQRRKTELQANLHALKIQGTAVAFLGPWSTMAPIHKANFFNQEQNTHFLC